MTGLAFVDTETTGLHPLLHEVWEVAIIVRDHDDPTCNGEHHWFLPVTLKNAEPKALKIGHFEDRYSAAMVTPIYEVLPAIGKLTAGCHLVGAVPSFDEERLRRLLNAHQVKHSWHYHLVDVEALAVGYLAGLGVDIAPPWNSDDLTERLGVVVPVDDVRHTALGDARWAMAIYDAVLG